MPHPTPIDITNIPELVRIAKEVAETKTPRELKRDNKILAVLMPAEKAGIPRKKQSKTKEDYDAFFAAFGSWKEVDTDTLLKNIYAQRKRSNRPPRQL